MSYQDELELMKSVGMEIPADLPRGTKVVLDTHNGSGKFPGVWTIDKINQRTYGMKQDSAVLKADKTLVRNATPEEILAWDSKPKVAFLIPGQLVRAPSAHNMDRTAFYVVLSARDMNPRAKIKVALLGGEGIGRTWSVTRTMLEPVSVIQMLALMA
jgi:hypothetical protein